MKISKHKLLRGLFIKGGRSLILKVTVNFPEDPTELMDKAADIMSDILIKKLQPKEIEKVIDVLSDEKLNIGF
jgi:hypothetical protein